MNKLLLKKSDTSISTSPHHIGMNNNDILLHILRQRDQLIEIFKDDKPSLLKVLTSPLDTFMAEQLKAAPPAPQPAPSAETPGSNTGPIVQLYDPSDLTKVARVIDGLMHAMREIPGTSIRNIKEAAAHRTIYHNYRWFLIPRKSAIDPTQPQNIGETVATRARRMGFVAMLNIDQTAVLRVYPSQKEAADAVDQHTSLVSNAIKYNTITKGNYWAYWDDLTDDMRNTYLALNQLPKATPKAGSLEVQKIDPDTKQVVHTYPTLQEVYTKEGITTKAIKHASETENPYKGFQWKIVKNA